jgi:predicted hotdog family 3-hydroxylacyl-ACP dehydratase
LALIEGPPAVESLLPHRDPMRLLRVIVEAPPPFDRIHGIAVIPPDNPLATGQRAPAFLGLEAAAQAAAALEALSRRTDDPGPRLGYLVGVRDATFYVPDLAVGEPLAVIVEATGSAPPLAVYTIRIEQESAVLVTGTISTYVPS